MDLSIGLVNWNNRDHLRQCLDSIRSADLPITHEIVVADHASTDGSLEMLAEGYPEVTVIRNEGNVGVARGNNQCIRHSTGRYVYILNNDTVVNRASIMAMVSFLESHPEAGAAGGNLLNPDGSLQASFCHFPTLREELLIVTHLGRQLNRYFPYHDGPWPAVREVDWLSSASIVVRRAAIEEIGLIDESFFVYSDETDWQYRLWQAGWKVYYLPEVTTIHYGGASFEPGGVRYALVYRGRMLFARKHYSRWYSLIQRLIFGAAALGREAVWLALLAVPRWRPAARRQISSNLETMRYALHLDGGIPARR
jgi:GT2 family glycosyltransferase